MKLSQDYIDAEATLATEIARKLKPEIDPVEYWAGALMKWYDPVVCRAFEDGEISLCRHIAKRALYCLLHQTFGK